MPLRSDKWPDGLPDLVGVRKIKVQKANAIYRVIVETILMLEEAGILWSVENPIGPFAKTTVRH